MNQINFVDAEDVKRLDALGRRSRFVTNPTGIGYRITASDLDIIDPLQDFEYLPSTYLCRFAEQLNPKYVQNRITVLRHEMKLIAVPPASRHAANARYRPLIYQLTNLGRDYLKASGRSRRVFTTSEKFPHKFGTCLAAASFKIGRLEHPGLNYHDHEAILGSPYCPEKTRNSTTPFQIPVTLTYHYEVHGHEQHKKVSTFLKHDGKPFGFSNPANGKKAFFQLEFDRHTKSYESEDVEATAISKKLQAIRALAANDGYYEHYGVPNMFIVWVAIDKPRMSSLMRQALKVTMGKGSQMHLFTTMPDFASFEAMPEPNGSMLTRTYKRAGYSDFNILQELGVYIK